MQIGKISAKFQDENSIEAKISCLNRLSPSLGCLRKLSKTKDVVNVNTSER